jgi:hypothetical protein
MRICICCHESELFRQLCPNFQTIATISYLECIHIQWATLSLALALSFSLARSELQSKHTEVFGNTSPGFKLRHMTSHNNCQISLHFFLYIENQKRPSKVKAINHAHNENVAQNIYCHQNHYRP